MNPLLQLTARGQSIWLDNIPHDLVSGGGLQRLTQLHGITGVTSNPTSFNRALLDNSSDHERINDLIRDDPDGSDSSLIERLMIEHAQIAADALRPAYDRTQGADGFVSLELSPACADSTEATIAEARRMWFEVARLNVMIKVPVTADGIAAVEVLVAQGINVNTTLLFSLEQYEAVAKAYLHGTSMHSGRNRVTSVASILVNALDRVVDRILDDIGSSDARRLRGRVALANARQIYRRFVALFHAESTDLQQRGVLAQRPLWANTATGNPSPADLVHLDCLALPDTVAAVSTATLDAFRERGTVPGRGDDDTAHEDEETLARAAALGVNLAAIGGQLQAEAMYDLSRSYAGLLDALAHKRRAATAAAK